VVADVQSGEPYLLIGEKAFAQLHIIRGLNIHALLFQEELQVLIGGASVPIDLSDLKSHVLYEGGFQEEHPTIKAFWAVVNGFGDEDRRQLLKFVTSCARPPLLGFGALTPTFCIRNAGEEEDRLRK
jgi:ubiquitin-protein ligase E3 C